MRVVAPVSMELMATPASTMPSGLICRKRESPRITAATASEPAKEHRVTPMPLLPARPSTTMAKAAPKVAPWETPSVEAEASGLFRMACKMHPASPSPAPPRMAVQMRGRRLACTTRLTFSSCARPNTPRTSSASGVS